MRFVLPILPTAFILCDSFPMQCLASPCPCLPNSTKISNPSLAGPISGTRTELVQTEEEDGLVDLEAQDSGLDEAQRLAVDLDEALAGLAVRDSSGGLLLAEALDRLNGRHFCGCLTKRCVGRSIRSRRASLGWSSVGSIFALRSSTNSLRRTILVGRAWHGSARLAAASESDSLNHLLRCDMNGHNTIFQLHIIAQILCLAHLTDSSILLTLEIPKIAQKNHDEVCMSSTTLLGTCKYFSIFYRHHTVNVLFTGWSPGSRY
jgi:hypothetical protein